MLLKHVTVLLLYGLQSRTQGVTFTVGLRRQPFRRDTIGPHSITSPAWSSTIALKLGLAAEIFFLKVPEK